MNYIKLIISTTMLLVISALVFSRKVSRTNFNMQKKVAILEPAIHPAIDEISQGVIDTLNASTQTYQIKRYNANGNRILMNALAHEIKESNCDLIVTIGVGCTLIVKELRSKYNCTIPQVFTAVDDPLVLSLADNAITGVTEKTDYLNQIQLLLLIKPSIKTVALVYDPSHGSGLEKDKNEIESILKNKKIRLQVIEIQSPSEIQQKVSLFMESADAVLILKDNTTVSGLDSLLTLCKRYQIPLVASDLNSGNKGAVLSYGIKEYDSGVEAAKKALLILEHNKMPNNIPVSAVETLIMQVNTSQQSTQGITLDHIDLTALPVTFIN
ncbi:ABC transporter substrate-binding protein [Candidatus Dependentiae bacterium Noda2021]|nr:ABC transporter substrate-binding protein [Candidatus Dependentiae bacterium Noda2021]